MMPNGKTVVFTERGENDVDLMIYGDSSELFFFTIKLDSNGSAMYAYLINSTSDNIADSVFISDDEFYMSKEDYRLTFTINK
jgi:hypothetical protein